MSFCLSEQKTLTRHFLFLVAELTFLPVFGIQIGHFKLCVCVCVCERDRDLCVCVQACLRGNPIFECLLAAVVRRGEARYSNFVSQFEYTLCTYQMRAQMRRLVNRICFSLSLFLQEQRERGGGKNNKHNLLQEFSVPPFSTPLKAGAQRRTQER